MDVFPAASICARGDMVAGAEDTPLGIVPGCLEGDGVVASEASSTGAVGLDRLPVRFTPPTIPTTKSGSAGAMYSGCSSGRNDARFG